MQVAIEFLTNCFDYLRANGIPTERVMWMHDNARPHKAGIVEQFLDNRVVHKIRQPAYSPDLNMLDRYIFRNMESARRSTEFNTLPEMQAFVGNFLNALTPQEMRKELANLRTACAQIIQENGNYLS